MSVKHKVMKRKLEAMNESKEKLELRNITNAYPLEKPKVPQTFHALKADHATPAAKEAHTNPTTKAAHASPAAKEAHTNPTTKAAHASPAVPAAKESNDHLKQQLLSDFRKSIAAHHLLKAYCYLRKGAAVNGIDIKNILWLCVNQRESEYFKTIFDLYHTMISEGLKASYIDFAAENSCSHIIQHLQNYFKGKNKSDHGTEEPLLFSKKQRVSDHKPSTKERRDLHTKEAEEFVPLCERIRIRRNSF